VGIIIELLIEGIAWILFEVVGELVGEGISSLFNRRRSKDVTVLVAPPGHAPPSGTGVILGQAGAIGTPAPPDGSGWGAPGSPMPDQVPPPAPPQPQPPAQPQAPPPVSSEPPVQAAVQVDASGCATWVFGLAMVVVMAGVGFWWGQRRYGIDPDEIPATLWVGIGLATLCFVLAIVRVLRQRGESEVVGPPLAARAIGHGWQGALLPWRWTPGRLMVFGLSNVALAAGVAAGFQ
jgi:hypothetical protein